MKECPCYTVAQVAQRFQISTDKVLYWINTGQLSAINVATNQGGRPRWRIDAADLASFEDRRRHNREPQSIRQRPRRRPPVKQYV